MQNQKQELFRKESVERLSSPERLDQLMHVVDPKAWIPLTALGSLILVALAWSIIGRIPITVSGQGVLVRPRRVIQLQAPVAGQLVALNVKVGDTVKQGDVLAKVDQSELRKQLQLERAKLADLQGQNQSASSLQKQRLEREKLTLTQQRQTLEQNLQTTVTVTPILKEKGLDSLRRDRQNLQERLQALQTLGPTLQQRLAQRQKLFKAGAVADDTVLQAQQEVLSNMASISDAQSQLKQLDVKEADAQRQYLENLNSITDIKAQLRDLDSKTAALAQQDLENSTTRQNQIADVQRNINRLELQLQKNTAIVSEYSGRVLEVTATPGQVLSAGSSLGRINAATPSDRLVSLTYFTIPDGKQIQPGMQVQVTPSMVKRERFGGIVGTVTNVSPFAATSASANVQVGNEELVKDLVSGGRQVEVSAELKLDPSTTSGYQWSSSKGPSLQISPSTTTSVRVKVGEKAPISYVIPIFRSITGIY